MLFLRDQASDSEEVVTPLMLDGTYLSRNSLSKWRLTTGGGEDGWLVLTVLLSQHSFVPDPALVQIHIDPKKRKRGRIIKIYIFKNTIYNLLFHL